MTPKEQYEARRAARGSVSVDAPEDPAEEIVSEILGVGRRIALALERIAQAMERGSK